MRQGSIYSKVEDRRVLKARMPRKDKKQELCSWIQDEIDDYYHRESAVRDDDHDTEPGVGRAIHPRHKILYFLF